MTEERLEQWMEELLKISDADDKMTEKQQRILRAAVEIIAEKGYASTSTSEIAQKAGVAEGTIFRHYKTKKELLISIVGPVMTRFIAPVLFREFAKVLDADYPRMEVFLRAVIRNRYDFVKKNLPLLRILLQEIPFHPELRQQFVENVGSKVVERFERVFEHFQTEHQITMTLPPLSAFRMSVSVTAGFFLSRFFLFPDAEWDDETEIEHTIDFIMHGLSPRSNDTQ